MLTVEILHRLWPNGNSKIPGLVEGIADSAARVFSKYGLTTDLVIAHAMAQFSHECGAGLEMVENINYTAERAAAVWPSRFHGAADCYAKCDSYAGDPQFHIKLIDHVYGRAELGNRPYPFHDGSNNIGRGLSQTTGREGYQKLATKTGIDFVNHPEYASDPKYALEAGVADFINCGCLPYAFADDVIKVTQHLNGGLNGLSERKTWLVKWKAALVGSPPVPKVFAGTTSTTLNTTVRPLITPTVTAPSGSPALQLPPIYVPPVLQLPPTSLPGLIVNTVSSWFKRKQT